jgi:hypothetical protein
MAEEHTECQRSGSRNTDSCTSEPEYGHAPSRYLVEIGLDPVPDMCGSWLLRLVQNGFEA